MASETMPQTRQPAKAIGALEQLVSGTVNPTTGVDQKPAALDLGVYLEAFGNGSSEGADRTPELMHVVGG